MTMTLVETVTVGSGGAASIDFTGIAGTATDILLQTSIRSNSGGSDEIIICRFNNDTTTANYYLRRLGGTGSGLLNSAYAGFEAGYGSGGGSTSNTFSNSSLYIPNYASANAKIASADAVTENNATAALQVLLAQTWSGTSAITSIKLTPQFGTLFSQYSTASLYLITKGSGGATTSP